jgi:hypothetical protein
LVSGEHLFELPLENLDALKQKWSRLTPDYNANGKSKTSSSVHEIKEDIGDFQNV